MSVISEIEGLLAKTGVPFVHISLNKRTSDLASRNFLREEGSYYGDDCKFIVASKTPTGVNHVPVVILESGVDPEIKKEARLITSSTSDCPAIIIEYGT